MTRKTRWAARLACGLIALAIAPAAAPGQDSEYVSLFDGKSIDDWKVVPLNPNKPTKWEVVDGLMVGTGEASMIYSPKGDYKNFRFRAEIRINDGGNSGMYFRCKGQNASFTDGYECQINSTHTDPIKTGSIYTMVHIFEELVPPGEFFTQEVEVRDGDYRGKQVTFITVSVNGKKLYQMIDEDRTFGKGYFAFQQHDPGSKVEIRKVEVQELR